MGCRVMGRWWARWDKKRSIHSRSPGSTGSGSAHQRVSHELADAGQKFRAHGRMKAFRIAGADRQNSQLSLGAERREGHRSDLDRVLAEKILALRIAALPAARLAGLEQRFER